ncbi:MAG: acyltransferase [Candidatus Krumholzibacteriota bacterium]|nr:acyltransferase [Candidatus Krumholzibacteriota bacterium]
MDNPQPKIMPERRYDLDWLRVIVTLNLIPFHVAWMITSVEGFSFVRKGTAAWNILHTYVNFVSPLHMFLLFLVAGTSTFMALRHRSAGQYIIERVKRLLIPLLTFMIFLFPVLGYFWPTTVDLGSLNYLTQFWPWCLLTSFFSPITKGPNWAHMWFVGYLFIYSLILLPLFLRIRKGKMPFIDSWTGFMTVRKGAVYVMAVPLFITFSVLSPIWPFFRNNLYSDWGYFAYNISAFYFGFLIARDAGWSRAFDRHAVLSLILGIIFSTSKLLMESFAPSFSTPAYNLSYASYSLVAGLNTWFWVIAVLSMARRTLSRTNRFLRYFNRISYPFYIFHLAVISVTGHYITRIRSGTVAEFLIICAVSFFACIICCELVKTNRFTRFLFGIKG